MPTADKYEKINVFIKTQETWIGGFAAKGNPLQIERDAAKTKVKELEISWSEQKCNIDKNMEATNILVRKRRQKGDELASARQELAGHHYQFAIRDICDAKLRGKQITSKQANSRFESILNWLRAQEANLFK
jgi:hypothetical protein